MTLALQADLLYAVGAVLVALTVYLVLRIAHLRDPETGALPPEEAPRLREGLALTCVLLGIVVVARFVILS